MRLFVAADVFNDRNKIQIDWSKLIFAQTISHQLHGGRVFYGFPKHFLFRWTSLNTKLWVSPCKTVNHVTTLNILLYSLFWCNLVPILNCLFFQKGCSPCNQRHPSHFSDTGSQYTCHTSLKSSLLSSCRRRPPPACPASWGKCGHKHR